MQEQMIYAESPNFETMIEADKKLHLTIKQTGLANHIIIFNTDHPKIKSCQHYKRKY
jgi:hypothetical protein